MCEILVADVGDPDRDQRAAHVEAWPIAQAQLTDGREVAVKVPEDKKAGDSFEWALPPPKPTKSASKGTEPSPAKKSLQKASLAVIAANSVKKAAEEKAAAAQNVSAEISVPPTWKRGQSLKLKLTDGREVAVKVPDDKKAGDTFEWTMPVPAAKPKRSGSLKRMSTQNLEAERKMLDEAQDAVKATSESLQETREEAAAAIAKQEAAEAEAARPGRGCKGRAEAAKAEEEAAEAAKQQKAAELIQKRMREKTASVKALFPNEEEQNAKEEEAKAEAAKAEAKAAEAIQMAERKRAEAQKIKLEMAEKAAEAAGGRPRRRRRP